MNVCIYEPERGPTLHEDNDDAKMKSVDTNVDLIPTYGTTSCLEDSRRMTESLMEGNNYVGFKSDNWCVDAGCVVYDGHDINFVPCRDEDQYFELKVTIKC